MNFKKNFTPSIPAKIKYLAIFVESIKKTVFLKGEKYRDNNGGKDPKQYIKWHTHPEIIFK